VTTERCEPRRRVVFAKTHKTGSTSVQNILHRAAEAAGLLVVLPRGRRHLFPLARPFHPDMAEAYGGKERFEVFAAHSLWDGAMVARLVPAAFTLTILREPVAAFESWFGYMHRWRPAPESTPGRGSWAWTCPGSSAS